MAQIKVIRFDSKTNKFPEDIPGYETVLISQFHDLSPDMLKTKDDMIVTNVWEFSKLYTKIFEQTKQTWWNYPAETHYSNNTINKAYWTWRNKGTKFERAIRFPNGSQYRNKYEYVLRMCELEIESKSSTKKVEFQNKTYEFLNHAEARIKLFYPMYIEAAKKQKLYGELKAKIDKGVKLAIYDIDGPLETKQNGVKCINKNQVDVTKESITEMLNCKYHTFSAGFCLAVALLDKESWLTATSK